MKRYFIIIPVIFLIIVGVASVVGWNLLESSYRQKENEQSTAPVDDGETTMVYGVKMRNQCFAQFQKFLENYGSDYSQCLVRFDFSNEFCGGFDPNTQGLSDVSVVVILDASGSMAERIGLDRKIDIAKKAVSDFLTKTPRGVKTGLVVYGHKGSNSEADKEISCNGVEEVVGLNKDNNVKIITAMNSFNPQGWTPIASSIALAKDIFINNGKDNKNYLILVSDGAESCGGDPLAAAENLKSEIPEIKLITIGFAADGTTRDLLTKIALKGGGSYLNADSSSGIADAFNKQLLVIKKDCITMDLLKVASGYKTNNLNNLNCWLGAYQKESDNFTKNILDKPTNMAGTNCGLEIANALKARHTEFWFKKQELEENNITIYKEIEDSFKDQLKAVEK